MRHEKISLSDLIALPEALAKHGVEAKAESKRPVGTVKHFHFCGRMPSRNRTTNADTAPVAESPVVV